MPRINLVRILALVSLGLTWLSFYFRELFSENVHPSYKQLLDYDGYGAISDMSAAVYILIFLYSTALLGIFFAKSWGIVLMIIWYVLSAILSLFMGMLIILPIESLLGWLGLMLDTIILVLYFSNNPVGFSSPGSAENSVRS